MHPQRHTSFETWQADVMRTLVDAGPLATSHFAATERHQESLRMASGATAGGGATQRVSGVRMGSFRQDGVRALAAVRAAFRALRPKAAIHRSVSGSASVR